jgi:hypothetical protein
LKICPRRSLCRNLLVPYIMGAARFSWTQNQVTRRCAIRAFFGERVVYENEPDPGRAGGALELALALCALACRHQRPTQRRTVESHGSLKFGKTSQIFGDQKVVTKVVTENPVTRRAAQRQNVWEKSTCHRVLGDTNEDQPPPICVSPLLRGPSNLEKTRFVWPQSGDIVPRKR